MGMWVLGLGLQASFKMFIGFSAESLFPSYLVAALRLLFRLQPND